MSFDKLNLEPPEKEDVKLQMEMRVGKLQGHEPSGPCTDSVLNLGKRRCICSCQCESDARTDSGLQNSPRVHNFSINEFFLIEDTRTKQEGMMAEPRSGRGFSC